MFAQRKSPIVNQRDGDHRVKGTKKKESKGEARVQLKCMMRWPSLLLTRLPNPSDFLLPSPSAATVTSQVLPRLRVDLVRSFVPIFDTVAKDALAQNAV